MSASHAVAPRLMWLDQVDSTNTHLVHLVSQPGGSDLPSFTVVATAHQTAGKGRLGRSWQAPADTSLAVSVLVRPATPSGRPIDSKNLGWLGLLAALAMSRTCNQLLEGENQATVKWPNDVLIGDRKVCGVLSELCVTSDGPAVIVGAGVNVSLVEDQLPVATATSLHVAGATEAELDTVLSTYLQEFMRVAKVFLAAEGDVVSSGLIDDVRAVCSTLGESVRVELPSGSHEVGHATDLLADGSLKIDRPNGLEPLVVAAGDVTHLRVIIERD